MILNPQLLTQFRQLKLSPKVAVDEQAVPKPLMGEEHEHHSEKNMSRARWLRSPWHNAENGIAWQR